MRIEFDRYIITGSDGDFILNEKKIVKEGKNAGKETLARLGYYSQLKHLIRRMCETDIRTSDLNTLQAIDARIDALAAACEQAFKD